MKRVALIWVVIYFAASSAWALDPEVTVRINQLGETEVTESANPGNTTEKSLANLAYGMGAAHWYLDPIVMMLGSVFITNHNSHLNQSAFDQFVALDLEKYRTILAAFNNSVREVAIDGTISRKIDGKPQIFEIQNFLKRMGIPKYTEEQMSLISPEVLAIVTNWLKGAQAMAASNESEFYQKNPELLPTNIVKFFLNLTVQDILEGYSYNSIIYDVNSLDRVIEQLRDLGWLVDLGALQEAKLDAPNNISPSGAVKKVLQQQPKPFGASNAAAFVYSPADAPGTQRCAVFGEPHQPSTYDLDWGPFSQQKIFKVVARRPDGNLSHVVLSAYPNLPAYVGIHASENSSTAGTAAPTGSSLMFSAVTNGKAYILGGQSLPFSERNISLRRGSNLLNAKILGMTGFGDVFAWARDPETGSLLAISMRPKTASSLVAGLWNRIISGVKNDSDGYLKALADGLPLFGEAGCHPKTPSSEKRAYFSLNQGKVDKVKDEAGVTSLGLNGVGDQLLKIGVQPQAMCVNQSWVTSDNGPLKYGCSLPGSILPSYIDPGFKTFRQVDFIDSIKNVDGTLSVEDLFKIGTSTFSSSVRRTLDLVVMSVNKFGAAQLPSDILPKYKKIADDFAGYDGTIQDNVQQLLIAYIYRKVFKRVINREISLGAQVSSYLMNPDINLADTFASLSSTYGRFILKSLTEGIQFLEDECRAKGILTYSQALKMTVSGQLVAANFAGPGYDSRSNGEIAFREQDGEILCQLDLIASSPNKFVYTGDTFYYLPFGTVVSKFALEPGLYGKSNEAWGAYWQNHNKNGEGYGSVTSYRAIPIAQAAQTGSRDVPIVKAFTLSIPGFVATPTPTPTATQRPKPTPTGSPNPAEKLKAFNMQLESLLGMIIKLKPHPADRLPKKKQRILRESIKDELPKILSLADSISGPILQGELKLKFDNQLKKLKNRTNKVIKVEQPPFSEKKRRTKKSIKRLKEICKTAFPY